VIALTFLTAEMHIANVQVFTQRNNIDVPFN